MRTLTEVLVERERLIARCASERDAVASAAAGLAGAAAVADRLVAGGRFMARHPLAIAAAIGVAAALRGRSLVRFALRAVGVWRLAMRARGLLRYFRG